MIRRLGFAQALATRWCKDLAAIQRQDLIDDGRGGLKPSSSAWPTVVDNVACRVDRHIAKPHATAADNRLTVEGGYDVSFSFGTDIRNKDRVQVHTLGERVFKIIGPRYASDEASRIMAAEEIV